MWQGIQSADSIHVINLLTSGLFTYSQCHVDSLACAVQNVNNQTLTQVSQLYVHVPFCLKGNQTMTKSAHSRSCNLHGCVGSGYLTKTLIVSVVSGTWR